MAALASRFGTSSRISFLRQSRALFTHSSSLPPKDLDSYNKRKIAAPPSTYGIIEVPPQTAFVVERFGKYHKTLTSGWHFHFSLIDKISHVHSLKEQLIFPNVLRLDCSSSSDMSPVHIFYSLYIKIEDPKLASYCVENPTNTTQLIVREKLLNEILCNFNTVDQILQQRDILCDKVLKTANEVSSSWGVKCVRLLIGLPSFSLGVSAVEMREIKLMKILKEDPQQKGAE